MKIIVIGSSFAAIPAIAYLTNLNLKPTVIDVGNELISTSKHSLKKNSFLKNKNFDEFLSLGGFSNVWTGVVDKYDDYDLDNWPFGIEKLNNYYEKILKLLDYSELYNFITENKNPLNYKIKKNNFHQSESLIQENNLVLKNSSILGEKNTKELKFENLQPLNFKDYIKKLRHESKINYIKGKVLEIKEINNEVEVKTKLSDNVFTFKCNYLFLGCGSYATLKLIQNSHKYFEKDLYLKNNKKVVFPVYFNHEEKVSNFQTNFDNIFPIFQINYHSNKLGNIYSQISNINITLLKHFFPKINNLSFFYKYLGILKKFGFSYMSLDSKYGDRFNFDKDGRVNIYNNEIKKEELRKNLLEIISNKKLRQYFRHLDFPIIRNELSGNHFGSAFPMQNNRINFFDSDILGRTCDYKKISILDSSIFSSLSAKPPSYTIMANSLRIVENVEKENFFN